eukprot:213000_1
MVASTGSQTLYINNLNEKVKKGALKKALFSVFSQFGKIEEVVARRGEKLKGQAWVIFDSVTSATAAMQQMQGFPFYGKPMKIAFSREESELHQKRVGTWKPKKPSTSKRQKADKGNTAQPVAEMEDEEEIVSNLEEQPNKLLYVSDVPTEVTQEVLTVLFQQYHGFKEARLAPPHAFIEFGDAMQASLVLRSLRGYKLTPTYSLKLNFARSV